MKRRSILAAVLAFFGLRTASSAPPPLPSDHAMAGFANTIMAGVDNEARHWEHRMKGLDCMIELSGNLDSRKVLTDHGNP